MAALSDRYLAQRPQPNIAVVNNHINRGVNAENAKQDSEDAVNVNAIIEVYKSREFDEALGKISLGWGGINKTGPISNHPSHPPLSSHLAPLFSDWSSEAHGGRLWVEKVRLI